MTPLLVFILAAIPVVLSLYTVYLVYKIYSFNRLNKAWLFVAVGFILSVLLRFLILLRDQGLFSIFFQSWDIYESIIRIGISIFQVVGFWSMLRNFENFDLIENKVKQFIKKRK